MDALLGHVKERTRLLNIGATHAAARARGSLARAAPSGAADRVPRPQ
jgi:hypothetical protein